MRHALRLRAVLALSFVLITAVAARAAGVVPNVGGTAQLPIRLDYIHDPNDSWQIIDGLPPGTTIDSQTVLTPPTSSTEVPPPGGVGLTVAQGNGMNLQMLMTGTGALAGFNRNILLPLNTWIQDNDLRTPGDPVQSFDTDLVQMFGQIVGDPDFDLLRISGGTGFGMPSPGHTTLTQTGGGDWAVDSFFDITYRIDFVGRPGGQLGGMSGSTTGTIRMFAVPEPSIGLLATAGALALLGGRRRR